MSALSCRDAAMAPLWEGLNVTVEPGEFLAVLGPNGVGKSTLLAAALGLRPVTSGSIRTTGRVGFIPQQKMFDPQLPMRARDLVALSGSHGVFRRRRDRSALDALDHVGAAHLAERRVGALSGGQQQLVRQAQAFVRNPDLLLCDEPLLSLDPTAQARTVERFDQRRREYGTAVVFVTHGINPIIDVCDRVLYLTRHGHRVGPVREIMTSHILSELYQSDITVAEVEGKLVVL